MQQSATIWDDHDIYTGSAAIPPLLFALKDKNSIKILVFISYLIVTIIGATVGIFGMMTYGLDVSVLVINNLFRWPSGVVMILITSVKNVNLWSSFGILCSVASNRNCDIV